MKKLIALSILTLLPLSILFSVGVGIYVPDSKDYVTAEGTAYSKDENMAASSEYPVGSILNLSLENGKSESVYVNDIYEMPPDRKILLNAKAAENLGIMATGYDDFDVEIVIAGEENEDLATRGWVKYLVATAKSNAEALKIYDSLRANGLNAAAKVHGDTIELYVRFVPQYQAIDMLSYLDSLGYTSTLQMPEVNPYL